VIAIPSPGIIKCQYIGAIRPPAVAGTSVDLSVDLLDRRDADADSELTVVVVSRKQPEQAPTLLAKSRSFGICHAQCLAVCAASFSSKPSVDCADYFYIVTSDNAHFLLLCDYYGRPLSVSGRPWYILPMFYLFFFMAALFSGPG